MATCPAISVLDPLTGLTEDLTNPVRVLPMTNRSRGTAFDECGEATRRSGALSQSVSDDELGPDAATSNINVVPVEENQLREALEALPEPGDIAFGFRLLKELGRGTFGRVFLASQTELAARPVALKVSANLVAESRALAQLQHTNIVPVYSVHRSGSHQAVCMPYFGSTTLATLLRRYRTANALPSTGRELIDTLKNISDQTLSKSQVVTRDEPKPLTATEGATDAILKMLSQWSYIQASCWLIARLADGLGHAHDRGILHRDIKPANVLITDDGQPMLLDFGVAEEIRLRATVTTIVVGGTIPYMAPEQLEEIRTGRPHADARSDIYSMGIVLYELLTGVHPFQTPVGSPAEETGRMIEERRAGPPSVRIHNRDVSPGLESIVQTCLAGDPAKRYQSATDLRDDLDRHLADRPLAIAPEKSIREQAKKWARRHPRLTSHVTVTCVAVALLIAASLGLAARYDRLHRLEAEDTYRQFSETVKTAHYLLYSNREDQKLMAEGVEKAEAGLAFYGVTENADWEKQTAYTSLPSDLQKKLRHEIAETCVMLARGQILQSGKLDKIEPAVLTEALRLNTLAEQIAGTDPPRIIYTQRQTLQKFAGRLTEATEAERQAKNTPLRSSRDYYLAGIDAQTGGRHADAVPLYRKAQAIDPKLFWAYFGEGVCLDELGRWAEARGAYTAAVALWPDFPWTYHNRGAAQAHLGAFDAAAEDFSRAIELQPDFAESHIARAIAYQETKDYDLALKDLDTAIGLGAPLKRVLPLRAKLRVLTGNAAGANEDKAVVGREEPTTADGWILRGIDKMLADKKAALADFQQALKLNPRSVAGLMYAANVLDQLGQTAECIQFLDRVLAIDAGNVHALSGRGMLHARLKHWDAALSDAKEALNRGFTPVTVYQVAGIYAQLSTHNPEYKSEAITLLTIALRAGFGFDHIDDDTELDPIRNTPEFERVLQTARQYKPSTKK